MPKTSFSIFDRNTFRHINKVPFHNQQKCLDHNDNTCIVRWRFQFQKEPPAAPPIAVANTIFGNDRFSNMQLEQSIKNCFFEIDWKSNRFLMFSANFFISWRSFVELFWKWAAIYVLCRFLYFLTSTCQKWAALHISCWFLYFLMSICRTLVEMSCIAYSAPITLISWPLLQHEHNLDLAFWYDSRHLQNQINLTIGVSSFGCYWHFQPLDINKNFLSLTKIYIMCMVLV